MEFPETFVPTARDVGLLPMVTVFFLAAGGFAFLAAFVFFLASRNSVAPWHRSAALLSSVISLVTCVSYWLVRYHYHDMLHQLAAIADAGSRRRLIHDAYFAIGGYRYAEWAVTVPLLLLRIVLMLKVQPREIMGWLAVLMGAAFWMILAAFIGDQQLGPDGAVLAWRHSLWGLIATLGYAAIPYVLFCKLGALKGARAEDDAGRAFRLMALSTVTTWGIYPLGYLATALFPRLDLSWVLIAYIVADLVNKIGVFIVGYLSGAAELEARVPREAVQHARLVA